MNSQLTGIIQLGIPVSDIERATAFYHEKLGLQLFVRGPNMAFLGCGDIRIYLDANPGTVQSGKNSMIYFRSRNLEHAHAAFKELGVTVFQPPNVIASLPDREVWLMWIRDSEENLLGVMEERSR